MVKEIEILDTTLRDGEQTSGVSFAVREKLSMARLLLDELHVNRIEIASARGSNIRSAWSLGSQPERLVSA